MTMKMMRMMMMITINKKREMTMMKITMTRKMIVRKMQLKEEKRKLQICRLLGRHWRYGNIVNAIQCK
jgi:hypothetical protein